MRVVIDFEEATGDVWRGSVASERLERPQRFEGRLELLRQLEELVAPSPKPFPPEENPR